MTANFGPWVHGLDRTERTARLRRLRALALIFCRLNEDFIGTLRARPRQRGRAAGRAPGALSTTRAEQSEFACKLHQTA
jgi:hypothetical protein